MIYIVNVNRDADNPFTRFIDVPDRLDQDAVFRALRSPDSMNDPLPPVVLGMATGLERWDTELSLSTWDEWLEEDPRHTASAKAEGLL